MQTKSAVKGEGVKQARREYKSFGEHERRRVDEGGGSNEWLTPPEIIQSLGEFDLDPCAPVSRPWPTANKHFTIEDDGLKQAWAGRVWLNPPYGNLCGVFMRRLADHGNGISLTFARTETRWFQEVAKKAHALLFVSGRIFFHRVDGSCAENCGGAPSVLMAFGLGNAFALKKCCRPGWLVFKKENWK